MPFSVEFEQPVCERMTPINTSLGRTKKRSQFAHFLRLPCRWSVQASRLSRSGRCGGGMSVRVLEGSSADVVVIERLRYLTAARHLDWTCLQRILVVSLAEHSNQPRFLGWLLLRNNPPGLGLSKSPTVRASPAQGGARQGRGNKCYVRRVTNRSGPRWRHPDPAAVLPIPATLLP